jgi:IS1 family transposase
MNSYLWIYKMYNRVVAEILELGIEEEYTEQLENLSARASQFEIELYY